MRRIAVIGLLFGVTIWLAVASNGQAVVQAPAAISVATRLNITAVPAIGLTGVQGEYGRVELDTAGQASSDFQDNDGVTNHLTFDGPKESQVSGLDAPLIWDARVNLIAVSGGPAVSLNLSQSGPKVLEISTLQNYARCAPPAAPQLLTSLSSATAFGLPLAPGAPVTTVVTGSQLGLPSVATANVMVSLQQVQQSSGTTEARAWQEVTLEGQFFDTSGNQLYSGVIATAIFGDVWAMCAEAAPTAPTPTDPTPTNTVVPTTSTPTPTNTGVPPLTVTPTPTPTPTPTATPPTVPPPTGTATPGPTESGTSTPTSSSAGPGPSSGPPSKTAPPIANFDGLAGTGPSVGFVVMVATSLLGAGLLLVIAARQRLS